MSPLTGTPSLPDSVTRTPLKSRANPFCVLAARSGTTGRRHHVFVSDDSLFFSFSSSVVHKYAFAFSHT